MTEIPSTPNNLAAYCWSIADLLRGDFKQSQYGRIILPFTLLRRLEGVLEESKEQVLAECEKVQQMNLPEEAQEKLLLRATGGLRFFNTSKMDLSKLGETGIKANLESYIQGFSKDAREIFNTSTSPNLLVSSTMPTCSIKLCKEFAKPISALRPSQITIWASPLKN